MRSENLKPKLAKKEENSAYKKEIMTPNSNLSSHLSSLPSSSLRAALEQRAYEVWISEIMLQQTRVAVVIGYWTKWMSQWPTIHHLAAASRDDVLLAWKGLGYYSRATRIHEAAQLIVGDPEMRGLMPSDPVVLEAKIPGVGKYTAGAIAAIVFGRPTAMVDGNVLRVLSRQLGVLGDVKADRLVVDVLWAAAEALARAVADVGDNSDCDVSSLQSSNRSSRPGRWGQALMELGSTICTPRPNCTACPITSTCRAYAEGQELSRVKYSDPTIQLSKKKKFLIPEIEDSYCTLCEPFENISDNANPEKEDGGDINNQMIKPGTKGHKNSSKSKFFSGNTAVNSSATEAVIIDHARRFPPKKIKKVVRQEEMLACAIRRCSDGKYLIHRRPEKGLLAGLWELPSQELEFQSTLAKDRKRIATTYVKSLIFGEDKEKKSHGLKYCGEAGVVPWLFSHLKLTMHVHCFELNMDRGNTCAMTGDRNSSTDMRWRWAFSEEIDVESMGSGMGKCWLIAKEYDRH